MKISKYTDKIAILPFNFRSISNITILFTSRISINWPKTSN